MNRAGPVLGTGIDIVENERIRDSLERFGDPFRNRVFTPGEQAYCAARPEPVLHYAARFAAKEAVSKAFGTGIGARLGWLDIEVYKEEGSGEPFVRLAGKGQDLLQARGGAAVLVSLSHTKAYAAASAVLVGKAEA